MFLQLQTAGLLPDSSTLTSIVLGLYECVCHRGWLCYSGAFLFKFYVTYQCCLPQPNLCSEFVGTGRQQAHSQLLSLGQYLKPKDFVSGGFVLFGISGLFCRPDLNLF